MDTRNVALAALVMVCACGRPAETNVASEGLATAERGLSPLPPPAPGTPAGLPDDRTPLEEPKGPIDPKSPEAAGQVMQQYGALIEQRRMTEAAALWSNATNAAQFAKQFAKHAEVHAQVGKPGDTEGAAGSIYLTVPIVFYGRLTSGGQFNLSGDATLRRVNDVVGSTEAQRRWRIERIAFDSAG